MPKKLTAKSAKTVKAKEKLLMQAPKGMHDVLPQEQPWWDRIRNIVREIAADYNYQRIDTPILEYEELFARGIGEQTDVVEKEMYVVKTKGGDRLALRPEGTTPVVRAYVEHGLARVSQPLKVFYEGQMFRHEKPQAGRDRQFTHIGFEILGGPNDPVYDAQVISVFATTLNELKVKGVTLKLNSIGCKVCRPFYERQLVAYYKRYEDKLCSDCVRRLASNQLRLLDCKKESCAPLKPEAPTFLDKLCVSCSRHLQRVLEYLDELKIEYVVDNALVRGLDYYSKTVFEFYAADSAVGALPAGGRYDYLSEMLGGRPLPAVGGAVSFERLVAVMQSQGVKLPVRNNRKVFVIYVGDLAKQKLLSLIETLRRSGTAVVEAFGKESLKSQLKAADKSGAPFALILGQREIYEESIIMRDLRTGMQEVVRLDRVVEEVKKRLKNKVGE